MFLFLFFLGTISGGSELFARADVKRFDALREKALELCKAGRVKDSLPYFEKMVELQPYNEMALYMLALALLHQENVERPEAAEARKYRKDCLRAADLLTRTVAMQERYSLRSEDLGLRYMYLGLAYWYGGDSLRALSAFRKSYEADFIRLDAIYNQYCILEELGRDREAQVVLERYLELRKKVQVDD